VFTESENPIGRPCPCCVAATIFVDAEASMKNIASQEK
jgi:hypothetical protein